MTVLDQFGDGKRYVTISDLYFYSATFRMEKLANMANDACAG